MNEEKETCLNCKYFSRYYVLNSTLRFSATNIGFCGHYGTLGKSNKTYLKTTSACDLWQPRELQKPKEQYGIELMLQQACDLLSDIKALLLDAE